MVSDMKEFVLHVIKPQLLIPDIIMYLGTMMAFPFLLNGDYVTFFVLIIPLLLKIIWSVYMVISKQRQVLQWLPGDRVLYVCDDGEWILWIGEYEYVKTLDEGVMLKHLKHNETYVMPSSHDVGGKLLVVSLSEISIDRADNRYFNQSRLHRLDKEKQDELQQKI